MYNDMLCVSINTMYLVLLSYSRTKKKPCPFCGTLVLKRSKKCNICNKNFGVYTFGRKQCLFCGRVNLARMARCNECGQSLDKAPSARPKGAEDGEF